MNITSKSRDSFLYMPINGKNLKYVLHVCLYFMTRISGLRNQIEVDAFLDYRNQIIWRERETQKLFSWRTKRVVLLNTE
jgi:hypothetical protein